MRLALYGRTAFSLLMTADHLDSTTAAPADILRGCAPNAASLAYAHQQLPQLPAPLHLQVDRWGESGVQPSFVVHRTSRFLPKGSFLHAASGLYVAAPELCLAQIALHSTCVETVFLGSILCGSFKIEPRAQGGLASRSPITSIAAIRRFIERNAGIDGIQTLRQCLPYLTEKAASPPEVFLRMTLTLPTHLGGFGLPNAHVNRRITPTRRAQKIAQRKTLVPDLSWPDLKLDIEYDSDSLHLTGRQAMLDATKRLALESDGHKVITVTPLQLGNITCMEDVAREVNRRAGRRTRIRGRHFSAKQRELFRLDWSLSSFFDPTWLAGAKTEPPASR